MEPDPAIARITVSADWDAEQPLSGAALAAYATHGCLRLRGFAPPGLLDRFREEEAREIDDLEAVLARHGAVPVPAAAGDALVFHTFLLHRSQPNRAGATRWTLQARYFDFLNPTAIHRTRSRWTRRTWAGPSCTRAGSGLRSPTCSWG